MNKALFGTAAVALVCLIGGSLAAQGAGLDVPEPSAEKESFVFQPKLLQSGADNAKLRIVGTTTSVFAQSSSKSPTLVFGGGVTLVPGSFVVLNSNEAECRVNVDDDTFGAIEANVAIYSVNGSKVQSTLRGTLGVTGPADIEGSDVTISVEDVPLVQINVSEPQDAGTVVLTGPANGTVQITAPTGAFFSQAPVAESTADINTPQLGQGNSTFTFGVGNATKANITVRITGIRYNTNLFTLGGGVAGALACEVSGAAVNGQSTLVVHAHTALTTVDGENDTVEDPNSNNGDLGGPGTPSSEESGSTSEGDNTSTPVASVNNVNSTNNNRSISGDRDRRRAERERRRQEREQSQRSTPTAATRAPTRGVSASRASAPRAPQRRTNNIRTNRRTRNSEKLGGGITRRASARNVGKGGSSSSVVLLGNPDEYDENGNPKEIRKETQIRKSNSLTTDEGLRFCDKDFKPIDMVVMNKALADQAVLRVWIKLIVKKDSDPDKVNTESVRLKVNGKVRSVLLTETGKNTGEFRCGKEGVLVVCDRDPDSNRTRKASSDPKARPYR